MRSAGYASDQEEFFIKITFVYCKLRMQTRTQVQLQTHFLMCYLILNTREVLETPKQLSLCFHKLHGHSMKDCDKG